jgi:methylamine dehydrogenase light chain
MGNEQDASTEGDFVDSRVEEAARHLAQSTSRRSFLGWAGKLLIIAAGAGAVVPTLPVDRRIKRADATVDCSYWAYCYMDGYPCANCGGTDTTCPSGCTAGNYWTQCCQNPADNCYYHVGYTDCCGCSITCTGSWCSNSSEGTWCGGAGSYSCTLAHVTTKCPIGCPSRPAH